MDEAGVKVMMALLRELAGPNAPFDDRELWNGIRGLINAGLLNIYFRFGADGIEVRPDFLIPPENDNHRRQPTPGGYTALTAPVKASVTVAAKAVGGVITPNTHLIAYASRDDGTTWTAGTLTAAETLADGTTIYETGDFDISGQPSGTAMKWRIVTDDAFEVQVHAVSLLWR